MVKLPFLFDHYNETASGTSVFEFLTIHYSENQHEDNDHDHGKLPFKHSEDGCSHHPAPVISVVIKSENHYSIKPPVLQQQKIFYTHEQLFSSFIHSIWQPPKLT
jgi:hypothetical protein